MGSLKAETAGKERQLQEQSFHIEQLHGEIYMLKKEVVIPKTPSMLQYQQLNNKIEALEVRNNSREKEVQKLMRDRNTQVEIEKTRMKVLHAEEMKDRDELIGKFRDELDTMLLALEEIRDRELNEGGGRDRDRDRSENGKQRRQQEEEHEQEQQYEQEEEDEESRMIREAVEQDIDTAVRGYSLLDN